MDSCKTLKSIIQTLRNESDNRAEFSQYIWQNSFSGLLTDPISNPKVLEENNVRLLAKAFRMAIESTLEFA